MDAKPISKPGGGRGRSASRIVLGITAAALLMLAAAWVLALLNPQAILAQLSTGFGYVFVWFTLNGAASAVLGLVILSRHPGHGVGRLLLAIGFLFSWNVVSQVIGGLYGMDLARVPESIRLVVALGFLAYILPLAMTLGLIPLYFPNGRLPSPRWRPVLVVVLVGIVGVGLTQAGLDMQEEFAWLQGPGIGELLTALQEVLSAIMIFGIVASLVSLVLRYTRSRESERKRIRWLVYTAATSITLLLLMSFTLGEDHIVLGVFASGIPSYLTFAIGAAILRHRLWDIDILIRRTLSYAILTAVLGLIYFGAVVLLQGLFVELSGSDESPFITVISTLAIAALFNPLRTRIQSFIDRRFYRARYDAEQALAGFSQATRDEVDLHALSDRLMQIVDETVTPERIELRLRLPGGKE